MLSLARASHAVPSLRDACESAELAARSGGPQGALCAARRPRSMSRYHGTIKVRYRYGISYSRGSRNRRRRVAASQVYVDALLARRRPALDSHFLLSRLSALLCKARPGTPREPKGVGDAP